MEPRNDGGIVWVVYDPFGAPLFFHEEQRKVAEWILDQPYDIAVGRAGGYRCKLWCPLVGEDDYDMVSAGRWRLDSRGSYASCGYNYLDTKHIQDTILMHRFIMGLTTDDTSIQVDHRNGDGLDNRRSNLRLATHAQNLWNSPGRTKREVPYKGVTVENRFRDGKKYYASIKVNGRRIYLGMHDTPEKAARAYDIAAKQYHKEFAKLNFEELLQ